MEGRGGLEMRGGLLLLLLLGSSPVSGSIGAGRVIQDLLHTPVSSLLAPSTLSNHLGHLSRLSHHSSVLSRKSPLKALRKQLARLPSLTRVLAEQKELALEELKARLLGEELPAYPRYTLPPLTTILRAKQEEALGELTDQLAPLGGLGDRSLVSALVPSVARLVEEPDLLPALAATVTKHIIQSKTGTGSGEADEPEDKDRKPVPQLIEAAGLGSEVHEVVTEDGYILTLHRILAPGEGPKPVVFLQHGLLCSSADWVIGARSKAFGFLLADAGYDVWLGNFRGNVYSRAHTQLDPEEEPFWRFSWDHMGKFDLPAMINKALAVSGAQQVTYIGHSMGTTSFWVMMNWRPWMNAAIRLMVGLAPVAAVPNMYSPIRYLTPVAKEVERMLVLTGQYEFGARNSLLSEISETLCNRVTTTVQRHESACAVPENIIFAVAGFDAPQMNFTLLPVIVGHTPAGTSSRTVLHFAQGVQSGRFREFDFGDEQRNMEEYGVASPPEYSLQHVRCPVVLYWGENDWLTQPEDVAYIATQLPGLVASHRVPYDSWNHLDFLWGKDADSLLYRPIMEVMAQMW